MTRQVPEDCTLWLSLDAQIARQQLLQFNNSLRNKKVTSFQLQIMITPLRKFCAGTQMLEFTLQLSSLAAGGRFSYNTVRFGFSDSTNQTMSVCCEPPDDDSDTCPICHDTFIDPVRTPCKHWCDLPGN